jgi:hypothetical protein
MQNPFIFGGPVSPSDFYGRSDSIQFIMDRLYGRSRSSIALWGDRRVGKSSLLYYIAQPVLRAEFVDEPAKHHMIFVDCQIFTPVNRQRFWREVLEQLADLDTDSPLTTEAEALLSETDIRDRSVRRFFRKIQNRGETVTLLLDEFTYLIVAAEQPQEIQALLAMLRTLITAVDPINPNPRPFTLITSTRRPLHEVCRPIYGSGDVGSPFYNPFVTERLRPFALADVQTLITTKLVDTTIQFTQAEVAHLLKMAGRHPILVQSYASELFRAKQEDALDLAHIDQQFYERSHSHFHDFWFYSGEAEQSFLGRLVDGRLDRQNLSSSQENAQRQLLERGLLMANQQLFSSLFADWLRLNIGRLRDESKLRMSQPKLVRLLAFVEKYFDVEEMRDLCFELGLGYDSLGGEGHRGKGRELVLHMARYGRLSELEEVLKRERPNLNL